jgi:CDP-6-deoxy-D-xylo-4-hexulose-3-dehydrase
VPTAQGSSNPKPPGDRVFYSSSVHDEREIEAVVEVLRSGPQGLWPGRRVNAMEREVASRFGKDRGVMVNSGSSALYLAVELLGLQPGDEVVTCALTFSTDVAAILRGGLTPVFVDVEPRTFCVDVSRVAEMLTPRTGAMLFPNLIGNAPDWDAIRTLADGYGVPVVEDSCDTLGARLRGTPTGARSSISVTSFANSHIITCGGNGGMVMVDDDELRDRALLLRRWGRRSELHFFGSKRRDRNFWEDLDGVEYDNQFIFDELAWNFEPSEMGAAFGLEQLKKLDGNLARRREIFDHYTTFFAPLADRFELPRQLQHLETAWLGYPLVITEHAGFGRPEFQRFLDARGIETRTIWTGNVARQPMLRGRRLRQPADGLPNADVVMARGVLLPLSHAIDDPTLEYVLAQLEEFLASTEPP